LLAFPQNDIEGADECRIFVVDSDFGALIDDQADYEHKKNLEKLKAKESKKK